MFKILVLSYANGDVLYCGPFSNKERAEEYARSVEQDGQEGAGRMPSRWHVANIVTPLKESREFTRQKQALRTLEAM